jgi:peroxiredoxin Q/BCP
MLEIGDKAPDFTLTADDGSQVSLSDYLGQKVVIYFYPKADTSGCTKQACALRDVYPRVGEGLTVIGISPDPPDALVRFREKYDLPFVLLSDPDHKVAKAYGAWGEKTRNGKTSMGLIRSHFAVDEKGKLVELKLQAQPLTTAEMAVRLVELPAL